MSAAKASMQQTQQHWDDERAKNWHRFMPPARPSAAEMACYQKGIMACALHELPVWALLGGTPEIRSLAARHNKHLLCIDQNADVLRTLESMVSPRHSEDYLCSDWLTMRAPLPVDLVFADGSLNMLCKRDHGQFIASVANMLAPRGWLMIRVHLARNPRFSTPREIFAWRRKHHPDEPVFSATRTELDMLWMDPDCLRIDFVSYHERIAALYREGVITPEEFDAYNQLLANNKIELHYIWRDDFESMISERFCVREIFSADDYPGSEQHPIYLLQKI